VFKKLFGKKDVQGDSGLGPDLGQLYARIDPSDRDAFIDRVSQVPSRGEVVVTGLVDMSQELWDTYTRGLVESWLEEFDIEDKAVCGYVSFADPKIKHAVYIKGDFDGGVCTRMAAHFKQYETTVLAAAKVASDYAMPSQLEIACGTYTPEQLHEPGEESLDRWSMAVQEAEIARIAEEEHAQDLEAETVKESVESADIPEEEEEPVWTPEKAISPLKPTNSERTMCQACQLEQDSRSEIVVLFERGGTDYVSHLRHGIYQGAAYFCRRCADHRFASFQEMGLINHQPARDGFGEVWFVLAEMK
jgi:hypothetical protein